MIKGLFDSLRRGLLSSLFMRFISKVDYLYRFQLDYVLILWVSSQFLIIPSTVVFIKLLSLYECKLSYLFLCAPVLTFIPILFDCQFHAKIVKVTFRIMDSWLFQAWLYGLLSLELFFFSRKDWLNISLPVLFVFFFYTCFYGYLLSFYGLAYSMYIIWVRMRSCLDTYNFTEESDTSWDRILEVFSKQVGGQMHPDERAKFNLGSTSAFSLTNKLGAEKSTKLFICLLLKNDKDDLDLFGLFLNRGYFKTIADLKTLQRLSWFPLLKDLVFKGVDIGCCVLFFFAAFFQAHKTFHERKTTAASEEAWLVSLREIEERKAALKAAFAQSSAALDEEMAALDEEMAAFAQSSAALDEEMAALDEEMAALDEEMAALHKEKAALDEEMAALDAKIAALDQIWLALQEKNSPYFKKLNELDQNFKHLESGIQAKMAFLSGE